ncbi:vestigial like 4 like [Esox lucius]|uniref:Vestigial like 4 like n=1 Tax=Esox lucius TaxID=8010 RepID=A0A3P8YT50_ESOLU|nr:vestigial like 4 like [Esox lucius]
MAVANFHYITRMSSGFKVYILEGQPNLRSEDRYRHITNERVRVPPVHPVKRKHSSLDRGLTLEERRERAQNKNIIGSAQRPAVFSVSQSPTSSWSPTASPTDHLPGHVYQTPPMDEPLDLIKKPRKELDRKEEKTKHNTVTNQIQMRPSVITCVSSTRKPVCRSEIRSSSHSSTVLPKHSYDHVVEEHFKRSLGIDYQKTSSRQLSISVSVDDHFAKALGEKWLQIKSKSSLRSLSTSSPPSSPSVTQSPSYCHSPNQTPKESPSTTTPNSSFWSVK